MIESNKSREKLYNCNIEKLNLSEAEDRQNKEKG